MNKFLILSRTAYLFIVFVLALQALPAQAQVTPNDTARYLAGMAPSPDSPLAALTKEPAWKRHASVLDQAWARLEKAQLKPIKAWSSEHLKSPRELMLYMFSGPDFLYADAFYPHAKTYILCALEAVGPMPDMSKVSRNTRAVALQELRGSMQAVLNYSFFITKQMKTALHSGHMRGTLPLIFVFLARSGNTINAVEYVDLNDDGTATPREGGRTGKGSAPGLKIVFTGEAGKERTLYYFRADLSNGGLAKSGFLKFVESFGPADSLIKSASYLLHSGSFKTARDFLLKHSVAIVQDPSGIPSKFFDRKAWDLHPFGTYVGPIPLFQGRYQRDLKQVFRTGKPKKIKFGIGYRWREHETSVLLATKKSATQ